MALIRIGWADDSVALTLVEGILTNDTPDKSKLLSPPPQSNPALGADDTFLMQVLKDPSFGRLNKFIANEIGAELSPEKLGAAISELNVLAKKAGMNENEVLELFKTGLSESREKGLAAASVLNATSHAIAFKLAMEKKKK